MSSCGRRLHAGLAIALVLSFTLVCTGGVQGHGLGTLRGAQGAAKAQQGAMGGAAAAAGYCAAQQTQLGTSLPPLAWHALPVPGRKVLGQADLFACSVLSPPAHEQQPLQYVRTALQAPPPPAAGPRLYQVLLLDCPADFWQLDGIEDAEQACLANTPALRASCNQWLVTPPPAAGAASAACAPPGTAFASSSLLAAGRVLVLQAHWQLDAALQGAAVELPQLSLQLGGLPAQQQQQQGLPLLGTFVGSGMYPPSSLSQGLQAFTLRSSDHSSSSNDRSSSSSSSSVTAELACGKRCTYFPLGRLSPKPVSVVGYGFSTFGRATSVAVEVRRGAAGKAAGPVVLGVPAWQEARAAGGVVALAQPFKLYPGDVVRWRCTYNTSGGALAGGHRASAREEQCTVQLHYWPRVDAMRGCTAATLGDVLLGENMCSQEAVDLLELKHAEAHQFPMRRMFQEHSFPAAPWMGGWKATLLILQMGVVLAVLWGSNTLLSSCRALGPVRTRFLSLEPGQQRNVSLYITHLLLDTLVLGISFQPMIELWFGWGETPAYVRAGEFAFTYIVACYALELTWRRAVDTMLAIHHIGTITIILLYAGEYASQTYRVANNIIVLAAFALMEQPTYIALLCKRMLPAHSPWVVATARFGCLSWFALKGASVLIASTMFVEDWWLMPAWIRINFVATWVVAFAVQFWSGTIQYGIYRQVRRMHAKAVWARQQDALKRATAAALSVSGSAGAGAPAVSTRRCATGSSDDSDGLGMSPVGSIGSDIISAGRHDSRGQLSGSNSGSNSGSAGSGSPLAGSMQAAGGVFKDPPPLRLLSSLPDTASDELAPGSTSPSAAGEPTGGRGLELLGLGRSHQPAAPELATGNLLGGTFVPAGGGCVVRLSDQAECEAAAGTGSDVRALSSGVLQQRRRQQQR